jgi:predicted nucleic acid-binding protein
VTTAQQYDLTAYDATYLEIAREQQLPVATLDRKLAAAAEQAGVSLVA